MMSNQMMLYFGVVCFYAMHQYGPIIADNYFSWNAAACQKSVLSVLKASTSDWYSVALGG